MKKLTKIIAATGIVAGLGVAGLPLVSYAVDPATDTTDPVTVSLHVNDAIAISVADSAVSLGTITPGSTTTGNHTTTLNVISNSLNGYSVTSSGNSLTNAAADETIPYDTVIDGNAAWGISLETTGFAAMPTVVETTGEPSEASGDSYTIYFGASTTSNQTTGDYSGTITFTATNQ